MTTTAQIREQQKRDMGIDTRGDETTTGVMQKCPTCGQEWLGQEIERCDCGAIGQAKTATEK